MKTFAVTCATVLGVTLIAIGLVLAFGDLGLSPHGYIALVLGVILSMALTMVLMGLVFLSNRTGHDEGVFQLGGIRNIGSPTIARTEVVAGPWIGGRELETHIASVD
jgi:hypothetical protein